MVGIRVNGDESGVSVGSLNTIAEVIELIKATIDPEHIVTSILIDGRELSDADWNANLNQFGTAIIEFETGTPIDFVNQRLGVCPELVSTIFLHFRDARKQFQAGDMAGANKKLGQAVTELKAFFGWFMSMVELLPEEKRQEFSLKSSIEQITATCKTICQQQLYQSWWALGETIKSQLEPQLDEMEDICRKFNLPISLH